MMHPWVARICCFPSILARSISWGGLIFINWQFDRITGPWTNYTQYWCLCSRVKLLHLYICVVYCWNRHNWVKLIQKCTFRISCGWSVSHFTDSLCIQPKKAEKSFFNDEILSSFEKMSCDCSTHAVIFNKPAVTFCLVSVSSKHAHARLKTRSEQQSDCLTRLFTDHQHYTWWSCILSPDLTECCTQKQTCCDDGVPDNVQVCAYLFVMSINILLCGYVSCRSWLFTLFLFSFQRSPHFKKRRNPYLELLWTKVSFHHDNFPSITFRFLMMWDRLNVLLICFVVVVFVEDSRLCL